MEGIRRLVIGAVVLGAMVPTALADPSWNRKALGIGIVPSAEQGTYEISFYYTITAITTETQLDLATEAEIAVNGDVVDFDVLNVLAYPPTDRECAGLGCVGHPCYCVDEPQSCGCGPLRHRLLVTLPLLPGDEVTGLIRAAPGAEAENNTTDDSQTVDFEGVPVFWERILENVMITPAPPDESGGSGFAYEISFDATFRVYYEGFLDLSTDALIKVNGTPIAGAILGLSDQLFFYCGGSCLFCWSFGFCEKGGDPCLCSGTIGVTANSVPANPGDEITLVLETPSGALPPLNGYGDQTELTFTICPSDCGDGDWNVGILDLLALLGEWGQTGSACDMELGTAGVGIEEFLSLLANWGPCLDP